MSKAQVVYCFFRKASPGGFRGRRYRAVGRLMAVADVTIMQQRTNISVSSQE